MKNQRYMINTVSSAITKTSNPKGLAFNPCGVVCGIVTDASNETEAHNILYKAEERW